MARSDGSGVSARRVAGRDNAGLSTLAVSIRAFLARQAALPYLSLRHTIPQGISMLKGLVATRHPCRSRPRGVVVSPSSLMVRLAHTADAGTLP